MDRSVGDPSPSVDDTEQSEASASRRSRWIVAVAAALIVVAGVAAAVVMTRPQPTYDDATQQRFVEVCAEDGGDPVRPACTCLYTAITEQIPYDRFVEIDDQLRAARDAGEEIVLPDDVAALVPDCQIPA